MSYLGGHSLQPKCECNAAKILFVLTTDMHGYIASTLGLLAHLDTSLEDESSVNILDLTGVLPLYTSRRSDRSSEITDFVAKKQKFSISRPSESSTKKSNGSLVYPKDIESDLYSFFLNNQLGNGFLTGLYRKKLAAAKDFAYQQTNSLFKNHHYCSAIVLNGRHVISYAVSEAAKESGVPVFFWEHRPSDLRLYFCDHPPQDFFSYEREYKCFSPTTKQILDAETWILKRTELRDSENLFSAGWARTPEFLGLNTIQLSVFTSSQDEFWSLGNLFPEKQYGDFYEEISKFFEHHQDPASNCILRMHPNTVNKAVPYAFKEIRKALRLRKQFPNLRVLWPNQNINSYEVVRSSSSVIVENSTVGVEAAFLKVPVRYLSPSIYVGLSSETMNLDPEKRSFSSRQREKNKRIAIKDVALIRSHYPLSYQAQDKHGWNKIRLIRSIDSPWTIIFLLARILNPRVNRLMFFVASKLPASRNF